MGLRETLARAFATPGSTPLSAEEQAREEALFDRLAVKIVERGLTVPAILFLEMHQPLSYMAGQLAHSLGPFATVVVNRQDVETFAKTLSRRDGIDRLVTYIERADARFRARKNATERPSTDDTTEEPADGMSERPTAPADAIGEQLTAPADTIGEQLTAPADARMTEPTEPSSETNDDD